MQTFRNKITLIKNKRGIYDLDTTKGCFSGIKNNPNGCYGDCYAARYSNQYGYNFAETVNREFINLNHLQTIRDQIYKIDMPFVRVGVTGDPSESWKHTISILKLIQGCGKSVVIITKHWKSLTNNQIKELSRLDVCFNTSISALDDSKTLNYRLNQHLRLKNTCKSILRVVSCDFNIKNLKGLFLNEIQNKLFNNDLTIDNVLRVSKNNPLVLANIINTKSIKFMFGKSIVTMKNKDTFIGFCKDCPEMCGLNL